MAAQSRLTRRSSAVRKARPRPRLAFGHKNAILSLVDRDTKQVRSFHVDSTRKEDVIPIIKANIAKEAHVMTDEAIQYRKLGQEFAKHDAVDHSREEWAYPDLRSGQTISINGGFAMI